MDYKDQSMPDEIRLIRRLLRTEDSAARKQMLTDAFKPNDEFLNPDGSKRKKQVCVCTYDAWTDTYYIWCMNMYADDIRTHLHVHVYLSRSLMHMYISLTH